MLCLFIIIKMEFIYKNVLLHLFWECKMKRGWSWVEGSTEIFEINLLRTWGVDIERRI